MRNLMFGLLHGATLAVVSSSLVAQRAEGILDAVTADPEHYSWSFENDVARFLRVK